jgi:hypothetical protein
VCQIAFHVVRIIMKVQYLQLSSVVVLNKRAAISRFLLRCCRVMGHYLIKNTLKIIQFTSLGIIYFRLQNHESKEINLCSVTK